MSKPIRILINTDSAALHSGLAETTRNIFIPLTQAFPGKYDIHQIGFFHINPREPVPWPIYQTKINQTPQGPQLDMDDRYSQKSFHEHLQRVKPDIVFGYGDMWMFEHLLRSQLRNTYRLAIYYTIDGQPYYGHLEGDGSSSWGKSLAFADELITLSHFGKDTLYKCCPEIRHMDIKVRYHPLDITRYRQHSKEQVREIRSKFLPKAIADSAFICGWLGRNQFRKQNFKLWEMLHYIVYGDYIQCKACDKVTCKEWDHSARQTMDLGSLTMYDAGYDYSYCWYCKSSNISVGVPNDNFYMWFHMSKNDPGYHPDLHSRIWKVENRCIYTNNLNGLTGISNEDLATLLAVWDCMYYPSGGEGFGNPAFECIAAGTPIVFSNYSSHAEFCKFGGLPVRVTYQPELFHGIQRSVVDTNHAVEQVKKLIDSPQLRSQIGQQGRMHAFQFHKDFMVKGWDEIFTNMMKKPLPVEGSKLYGQSV